MRVSAIHDRRFPAVNSCTKCNSRAEDAIHRGCKKTQFFYSPLSFHFHNLCPRLFIPVVITEITLCDCGLYSSPPRIVFSTFRLISSYFGTEYGSAESTAISAIFPVSREPRSFSSKVA